MWPCRFPTVWRATLVHVEVHGANGRLHVSTSASSPEWEPVAMTPPPSLGSDCSYMSRTMMQMDGWIAYNDAARTQDTCCWPLSCGRETRAHVGHGGPECPNSQACRSLLNSSTTLQQRTAIMATLQSVRLGPQGRPQNWYITEVRSQLFTNSDVGTCQYCTVRLQHPAGNGDRCHYTSHQFGERLLVHVEELRAWTEGLRTILRLALRIHVARREAWHSMEPQVV